MYRKHPEFYEPDDRRARIWRYLDFTKFVSMLEERALYFTRGDQFDDPFEGSRPRRNVDERFEKFCALHGKRSDGLSATERKEFLEELHTDGQLDREFVAINCWHVSEHESAAMWRLYLKSNEGIAIQSTVDRLVKSLESTPQPAIGVHGVHIGLVRYIDYESDTFEEKSSFTRFLHKRKSFQHENELRAIAKVGMQMQSGETFDYSKRKPLIDRGVFVPIDLETLISAVYIAPQAEWLENLVFRVMHTYRIRAHVRRTKLEAAPLF